MSRKPKPLSRLQQLREQIIKMGGEDAAPRFETLQLHAGKEDMMDFLDNNCCKN